MLIMCQELSRWWGSRREIEHIKVPALMSYMFQWSKRETQTSYKMFRISDCDKGYGEKKIKWVRRIASA